MSDGEHTIDETIKLFEWFGFRRSGGASHGTLGEKTEGGELIGTCPYCGKDKKFYLNSKSQVYRCMSASCNAKGNTYTLLTDYYERFTSDELFEQYSQEWDALERDRLISKYRLREAEIVYDSDKRIFILPVRNSGGTIVNYRTYRIGSKFMGLPTLPTGILYLDRLFATDTQTVTYICEGEWDCIALNCMLKHSRSKPKFTVAVAVPGAGVFKDAWIKYFAGRDVVLCYDKDVAGEIGTGICANALRTTVHAIKYQTFSMPYFPEEGDVRDFYFLDGRFKEFQKYIKNYVFSEENSKNGAEVKASYTAERKSSADKPAFIEVINAYSKHLLMSTDYEDAIRVVYATILSEAMPGDPLWIFLVGPPSSGKTVVLNSCKTSNTCVSVSTLSPKLLVSGFRGPENSDPSLLPKLNGKTLILKDYTEILDCNKQDRDDIASVMRGAFDGSVSRLYANGVTREYPNLHFSVVAGVTQRIHSDRSASMGERFLMYQLMKGNDHAQSESIILRAISNVGHESSITDELQRITREYVEFLPTEEDISQAQSSATLEFDQQIASLAQLLGMLRADVERNFQRDTLKYKPQYEMGARAAKQLKKLAICLALLEPTLSITPRVYRIVAKVALDTCIAFNLEVVNHLYTKTAQNIMELVEVTHIPMSTLRERLDDLAELGLIQKIKEANVTGRGAPYAKYRLSPKVLHLWEKAKLHDQTYSPI